MSIVFRMAGNGEYTQGRVPTYLDAIDRHFGPYGDHKAVQIARELAKTDSVAFDAPMNLAVRLKDVESLSERVPFDRADAGLRPLAWSKSTRIRRCAAKLCSRHSV